MVPKEPIPILLRGLCGLCAMISPFFWRGFSHKNQGVLSERLKRVADSDQHLP
jgi:hypothetical protein